MSTPPTSVPPVADPRPDAGIVASGWLGSESIFGDHGPRQAQRKVGATVATLALHGTFLLVAIWLFTMKATPAVEQPPSEPITFVYLQQPGPGGGGGGSPAPAPPKPIEIPRTKPPVPIPVVVPPPPVTPPPVPQLSAPIMTPNTVTVQASGTSTVSLPTYGGEGRGTGIGRGTGSGVGPGTGGGFGGGAYRPGSGISNPELLRQVKPTYTSDAMRAKIQGKVVLEVVVQANGSVGDVRVLRSLDRVNGLDQEAIKAAKGWFFKPAMDREGKPVAMIVQLELEFNIH